MSPGGKFIVQSESWLRSFNLSSNCHRQHLCLYILEEMVMFSVVMVSGSAELPAVPLAVAVFSAKYIFIFCVQEDVSQESPVHYQAICLNLVLLNISPSIWIKAAFIEIQRYNKSG